MLAVRCIGIILTMVSCQLEEIKPPPNSINSFIMLQEALIIDLKTNLYMPSSVFLV